MLRELLKSLLSKTPKNDNNDSSGEDTPLSSSLRANLEQVNESFAPSTGLKIRHFSLGGDNQLPVALVYFEELIDEDSLVSSVIQPLMVWARPVLGPESQESDLAERILNQLLPTEESLMIDSLNELTDNVLNGNCILLTEGSSRAISVELTGWPKRQVEEPSAEVLLRGPRDGFTENLQDNLGLIRRRIKSPQLAVHSFELGTRTKTETAILHMEDLAPENVVQEVHRRVEAIDVDKIVSGRQVQQLITDHPYSLLPTIRSTERPDVIASELLEGRVIVLIDTDPFVLLLPYEFFTIFATAEAHNLHFALSTVLRSCGMISFWLSIFITAFYVALTSYHQELVPFPLLMNFAVAQAGVPFPVAFSALGVEAVLEILREAGARLPRPIGQAVSIVGAIVLGQAAIQAGIIPPGLVIAAASATIFSFAVPDYEATTTFRLFRYPIIIMAGALGLFGTALTLIVIIFHLCSLKSFGVPYVALFTPGRVSELAEKQLAVPYQIRRPIRPGGGRDRRRQGQSPRPRDPGEVGND